MDFGFGALYGLLRIWKRFRPDRSGGFENLKIEEFGVWGRI